MLRVLIAIHVIAAVVYLGNLITAAFWKMRADRSGGLETMAVTSRLVVLSDCFFTGPGLVVLMATGILIVSQTGWHRFQEPWLGASFVMLVVTAIIWLAVLVPLERKMLQLAREGCPGESWTRHTGGPAGCGPFSGGSPPCSR
jgi:uncharacterized membrane protein